MPDTNSLLPIGLFAYADPRNSLDRLIDEQKEIRALFDRSATCEIIERPAADLLTIVQALQHPRYAMRTCIFHYGGHAGDYALVLNDASINTKPFNQLLAGTSSLRLVFLNGCSTKSQAADLTALGVPAVIASIKAVPDAAARLFAQVFYNGLVAGFSINDAFKQAKAATGSKFNNSYTSRKPSGGEAEEETFESPPAFLWQLWLATEDAGRWKIADELHNPYFGPIFT